EYPGRRVEFVHELRAFEHGRLLEESWTGPMAGTMVTRFTAVDDSTELAISMEINASGTAKILAPLMKRWLVRALRKDFVRLESMLAAGK
ncbi:MAG: hypothetical protein KJN73_11740, partial [Acidimicrobiia bacterium]|nr:hypothetical protein [Acidimicrobiia bacterium]